MPPPGATVLIVDDDPDVTGALRDALGDEGYRVAVTSDGDEALAWLRAAPALPAVIVLDWMMPRCDGATFLREQRGDARLAAVPVIVLTADMRLRSSTAEVHAAVFLKKPVSLEDLLAAIERFCPPG